MNDSQKPKRRYRRITAQTVAEHAAAVIVTGNATAAVRLIDPTAKDATRRAQLIALKSRELDGNEYIDLKLQQIATDGIDRIEQLVQSPDERIALKAATFAVEHVRGKAVQRSETKHLTLNIQSVLQ